jgi:hypothetical protein
VEVDWPAPFDEIEPLFWGVIPAQDARRLRGGIRLRLQVFLLCHFSKQDAAGGT